MTDAIRTSPDDGRGAPLDQDQLAADAARLIRDRAETVLNAVAEGVFLLDANGRTVFVNEAGARMFGYSAREMLGRLQHEMVHHHYADGSAFPIEECPIFASVSDGITQRVGGDTFWRKDGTQVPVDYTSIPIREQRRIVGAVVTFRDVTTEQRMQKQQELLDRERRAREEAEAARGALEASEERLRLAMSAGRLGSWEWNIVSGSVLWSPEEEALYGMEPGTFAGTSEAYIERIHPDDRERAWAELEAAMGAHAPIHVVLHRIVHPRGEVRWLESFGRFVYDEQGVPQRLVGVSIDVTTRVTGEAAADALQHRLESVLEASPSAISVTTGSDHVLKWANGMARELLGNRVALDLPLRELLPELVGQGLLEIMDRVYQTGESFTAADVPVAWDPTGDGTMREARFNIAYQALRDADGQITGVMSHSVMCG